MTVRELVQREHIETVRPVNWDEAVHQGYGVQVIRLRPEDIEILRAGGVLAGEILGEYGVIIVGPDDTTPTAPGRE